MNPRADISPSYDPRIKYSEIHDEKEIQSFLQSRLRKKIPQWNQEILERTDVSTRILIPNTTEKSLYLHQLSVRLDKLRTQLPEKLWLDLINNHYVLSGIDGGIRRSLDKNYDPKTTNLPNIDDFFTPNGELRIEPNKIIFALQSINIVLAAGRKYHFETQYVPALNAATFVAQEFLYSNNINIENPPEAIKQLSKTANNTDRQLRYKKSIARELIYTIRSLQKKGEKVTSASILDTMIKNIYNRISIERDRLAVIDQSMGIEIEVLQHINESPAAVGRGVDIKKWVKRDRGSGLGSGRGIPEKMLKRKDWVLMGICGIGEDAGERKNQVFELAPEPTDSAAAQNTIIQALIAGDFIDEQYLSHEWEGYSLHISTVFPANIWNIEAEIEYIGLSRVLSGAFSSDQRINYGGFAAGRFRRQTITPEGKKIFSETSGEVKNKRVGAKKIKKEKLGPEEQYEIQFEEKPPTNQELELVEIRTGDITPSGQFSLIHAKQALDFGFKCCWELKTNPDLNPSSLRKNSARIWEDFNRERIILFQRYSITESINGWIEMARVIDKNPKLRNELQQLCRKHAAAIRKEAQCYQEISMRSFDTAARSVFIEPQGKLKNRFYLHDEDRNSLQLPSMTNTEISFGLARQEVTIAMGKIRPNGYQEKPSDGIWRVSKNLQENLGIPEGTKVRILIDKKTKKIRLGPLLGICTDIDLINKPGRLLAGQSREKQIKDLINASKKHGTFTYVFQPQDIIIPDNGTSISDIRIRAYTLNDLGEWITIYVPFPDAIYSYASLTPNKIRLMQQLTDKGTPIPFLPTSSLGSFIAG